ncbi:TolC family protein [Methylomonas sp. BW4-1]|uniref:TolC family protein n=1 Tax=Methylomonas sp. BW4-1 TaxID=3376685 RepID=UPI00404220AA
MFISFPFAQGLARRARFAMLLAVLPCKVMAVGLSFDNALALALREAPVLTANEAQTDAARQAAIPAGELPDPQLALGIDNLPIQGADRFNLSRDFMTMQRVGVSQTFTNPYKLDARTAAAEGRVALAKAQTRLTRLQVLQETAMAWISREAVERQLARIAGLEDENRLFEGVVKARFAGGAGMASELLAPRQEAALIAERRDELDSRHAQAVAQLKRWIGEAASQALIGSAPDWPINREALSHGLHRHPELDLFDPKNRVLDAELDEAKADKIPDWALSLAYQRRGSAYSDLVSLQVSVDLPVFSGSRQQPKLEAKLLERNALAAERQAALQEHTAMLETGLAEHQRLSNAVKRAHEVLIPLAEEKVSLTLAAWRGNQGDLPTLLAARRERIDAELKAIALEGERRSVAARLHYAYGEQTLEDAEPQP